MSEQPRSHPWPQDEAAPAAAAKEKPARGKPKQHAAFTILKVIGLPLLCLLAGVTGLLVGYVYLGRQEPHEVFSWSTWKHLYDLVFADS
ncbi:DNA-directed RNA polymerase subunit beta [Paenibacillus sp. y28]|uniref:DNA-directed RNA polymerase subunit beta n=1 Tax=Paenibacillus sp. y28 TaxID=3129110 RepID=UPI0030192A66